MYYSILSFWYTVSNNAFHTNIATLLEITKILEEHKENSVRIQSILNSTLHIEDTSDSNNLEDFLSLSKINISFDDYSLVLKLS